MDSLKIGTITLATTKVFSGPCLLFGFKDVSLSPCRSKRSKESVDVIFCDRRLTSIKVFLCVTASREVRALVAS